MGSAIVDSALANDLLRDPRGTALAFGLAPADADMAADIHASDLRAFASALYPRLYGRGTPHALNRRAAAG
jgi:hypothetical protein